MATYALAVVPFMKRGSGLSGGHMDTVELARSRNRNNSSATTACYDVGHAGIGKALDLYGYLR